MTFGERCPSCGSGDWKTIDTRPSADGHHRQRRKRCLACGDVWKTYEIAAEELERLEKLRDAVRQAVELAIGGEE